MSPPSHLSMVFKQDPYPKCTPYFHPLSCELEQGAQPTHWVLPSYVYAGLFRGSERKQEQKRETRGSSFIFSL